MSLATALAYGGFTLLTVSTLAFWALVHLIVQARLAEASVKVEDSIWEVVARYPRRRLRADRALLSPAERGRYVNRFLLDFASWLQWLGLVLIAAGLLFAERSV
ncbi:hypothetical protein [Aquimonas voraii]|uniref:Uncharacterized protein n=1 Tax=Aquimonas voraii TaxID=265719 RepID=A0A1G6UDU7_9GAMM|nr:hypothetical protein [Aquimonas voraii]SDD38745.1 hypothetical protein SAMN04488509_102262 [Aquimonas voraii]